jgi:superfamily II DNA helicase RecQ
LLLEVAEGLDQARAAQACRAARDRAWRAYRAIEGFAFFDGCRRRALLDHFGDPTPGAPSGRCCDHCAQESWLPDPSELTVEPARRRARAPEAPEELGPDAAALFEALREWRLRAAGGKPAYTVANNRTLQAIASIRPGDPASLAAISGVGPAFMSRYADEVLALVAGEPGSAAA